jgi:hypothetical protein
MTHPDPILAEMDALLAQLYVEDAPVEVIRAARWQRRLRVRALRAQRRGDHK